MVNAYAILLHIVIVVNLVHTDDDNNDEFIRLIGRCSRRAPDFDRCMKDLFNDLRAYFPTGKTIVGTIFFWQLVVCIGFGSLGRGCQSIAKKVHGIS